MKQFNFPKKVSPALVLIVAIEIAMLPVAVSSSQAVTQSSLRESSEVPQKFPGQAPPIYTSPNENPPTDGALIFETTSTDQKLKAEEEKARLEHQRTLLENPPATTKFNRSNIIEK